MTLNRCQQGAMNMQCENVLCIYCREDECILNHVSINMLGMCADCTQVTIEAEQLERAKESLLQKLHEGKKRPQTQ